MLLALETGSFSLYGIPFEACLRLAREIKFDAIELWCDRKTLWPDLIRSKERRKIKERIDSYGLKVTSIAPDPFLRVKQMRFFDFRYNIAHPDLKKRRDSVKFYGTAFDVARDLEAQTVIVMPGVIETTNLIASESSYRNHWERARHSLIECSRHAEEAGVHMGIENAVICNFLDRPEELYKMVTEVGSDHVKVFLDISNANVFFPPTDYIKLLHAHLANCIHVSDNDGTYPHHLPIGMGTIDYRSCIDELRALGWNGYLIPELFYAKDPEAGIRTTYKALAEML